MEDISRELEKEIESYSSPARTSTKRRGETRLIAVDDFGKMKSADWIKKALFSLLVLCIVFFSTTILFYKLYSSYKIECTSLRKNLDLAERRVKDSIKEQEHLMAKLVISDKKFIKIQEDEKEIKQDVKKVIENKVVKVVKKRPKPATKTTLVEAPKPVYQQLEKVVAQPEILKASQPEVTEQIPPENEQAPAVIKNVGVERFMIVKEEGTGDILINFRVINVASEKGDASGRVFVLLSSKDGSEVNKLIVPTVELKDNVPAVPRRGQYFSIAHFKTVKFKIRNIPNPELFDKATVFVFGKGNKLILQEEINISINK